MPTLVFGPSINAMTRSEQMSTTLARTIAYLSLLATLGVGVVYGLALADRLVPIWLFLVLSVPILFAASVTFIARRHAEDPAARGILWWMPVVWILLLVNSGIVEGRADRATGGGHIETRSERLMLVVHGRAVRELDARGAREVARWDVRRLSSHLLLMLSVVSLGLVATFPPHGPRSTPIPSRIAS